MLNGHSLGEGKSALNSLLIFEQPDTYLDSTSRYPQSRASPLSDPERFSYFFNTGEMAFTDLHMRALLRTTEMKK